MPNPSDEFKKLIKSLEITEGPRSNAGSIKPDKLDALCEKMQFDKAERTEEGVKAYLGRHRQRAPMIFFTPVEVESNIRLAQAALNAPRRPASDMTRNSLRAMTPSEKLDFANKSGLAKATVFTVDGSDNLVKEGE